MLCMKLLLLIILFFSPGSMAEEFPTLRVASGGVFGTLDPTEAEDFWTIRVIMNLGSGLVGLDQNLKPVPALALKWAQSPDGKTYTFTLGDFLWSDGKPVTSLDFIEGFKRTLSPDTISKVGFPWIKIVKNGPEFKSGKIKDFSLVGVSAPDEKTVVINLSQPSPHILPLLALPFAFPQRKFGDAFPLKAGSPSCGPYLISEWRPGQNPLLSPNPKYFAPPKNRVRFIALAEPSTAYSLYKKDSVDLVERFSPQDYLELKKRKEFKSSPFLATYYLGFRLDRAPSNQQILRKAIAYAIDRKRIPQILGEKVNINSSLVPLPFETSTEDLGPTFNPNEARRLWESLDKKPNIIEFYFDNQERHKLIAEFVQQSLRKYLNLEVLLKPREWKTYLQNLSQGEAAFFRFAWLASYPDALSHLEVFMSNSPNNHAGFKNPKYDSLVQEVSVTAPGTKRTESIREAQKVLLNDEVAVIPLYHYIQNTLLNKSWTGIETSPMGILYFRKATKLP